MVRGHVLHGCCHRLGRHALSQTIDINGYWTIKVCYGADLGEVNSGFTATDYSKRLSVVVIGLTDSKAQLMNTISHEVKHVQSNICEYYNVTEDSEDAAYLTGYITMRMYQVFRNLI